MKTPRLKVIALSLIGLLIMTLSSAQRMNWQNKDLKKDSVFGISSERAYRELLGHKKARTVIVAVIDEGVDTSHEDLRDVIWVNAREKAGNGIDDDHNGYTDDVHGWNFIGGPKGNVQYDNLELTRLVRRDRPKYDSLTLQTVPDKQRAEYEAYRAMLADYNSQVVEDRKNLQENIRTLIVLDSIVHKIGKDTPTVEDFKRYEPQGKFEEQVKEDAIDYLTIPLSLQVYKNDINGATEYYRKTLDYGLNPDYDPRYLVGDDYSNDQERFYGNADVTGPDARHGTHVAGIIGAVRGNHAGIDGVADHLRIMGIRVVPVGAADDRDKDVANAIRYAADNGASVINMSFGKTYSWDKKVVDEAVKYAMRKDVLIVAAAGNDGKNRDDPANHWFPNKYYEDGSGEAGAWITVGASKWRDDSSLVLPFSNYGKKNVDVFAPGGQIYSCLPGSRYGFMGGTSMAAPIVSGLAVLIREYYPGLSALQVKDIILKSVVKPGYTVIVMEGKEQKKVYLSDICVSGGVVNAYLALKLAATFHE